MKYEILLPADGSLDESEAMIRERVDAACKRRVREQSTKRKLANGDEVKS